MEETFCPAISERFRGLILGLRKLSGLCLLRQGVWAGAENASDKAVLSEVIAQRRYPPGFAIMPGRELW